MAWVLAEAIRQGALAADTVGVALRESGCMGGTSEVRPHSASLCRELWGATQASVSESGIEAWAGTTRTSNALKGDLIEKELASVSSQKLRSDYLVQLATDNGLTRVLEILAAQDIGQVPIPEQAVAKAICGWREAAGCSASGFGRVRLAGRDAVRRVLTASKARPQSIEEARAIPDEIWKRVDREQYGAVKLLEDESLCTLRDWRKGSVPSNQWKAWLAMLRCSGGW